MATPPPPPPSREEARNMVLALVLMALVLFGWNWVVGEPPAPPASAPSASTASGPDTDGGSAPASGRLASPQSTETTQPRSREAQLRQAPRVTIASQALHGSIRLRGLRFDDLTLARYHEEPDPSSPEVTLLSPRRRGDGYYASFGWVGEGVETPDARTRWKASHAKLTPNQPVTFHWTNKAGVRFEQTVAMDEDYMFTITRRVIHRGEDALTIAPYSLINRTVNEEVQHPFILHIGPLGVRDDMLSEYDYGELREETISHEQRRGWAGITDKHWLTALVPEQAGDVDRTTTYQHYQSGPDHRYQIDMMAPARRLTPGATLEVTTRLFAGAKEVEQLDAYSDAYDIPLFDRAVDFGSLYFLTRPMFEALQWFNGLFGNFGLAILALTVCVKLLLFPLANKSYASMAQMKLMMPKMQEIREQYGEDKMRMNQEIMEMYKREGVNPASGCLPMVLQFPVFLSLYRVLFITIEMRHAPFYGWIQDLSAADPTNLFTLFGLLEWGAPGWLNVGAWPLMVALTMVVQQRLNPTPTDPTQAQVMKFLPYGLAYFFASFPAGLVIYFAWNNMLSIAQQWAISKRYETLYDKETGKRKKPGRARSGSSRPPRS